MNKKFASYFITGKAATLQLLTSQVSAQSIPIEALSEPAVHITQSGDRVSVLDNFNPVSVAANIVTHCTVGPPNTMNILVPGIQAGDLVFITSADDTDYSGFLSIDPRFRIGRTNLRVLASFKLGQNTSVPMDAQFQPGGITLSSAIQTLSAPVNLGLFPQQAFYMQAVVVRANGQWDFSELDRIERVAQHCDTYGNPCTPYSCP